MSLTARAELEKVMLMEEERIHRLRPPSHGSARSLNMTLSVN